MAHEWKLMCKHCGKTRVALTMDLIRDEDAPVGADIEQQTCPARYKEAPHDFSKRAVRYS